MDRYQICFGYSVYSELWHSGGSTARCREKKRNIGVQLSNLRFSRGFSEGYDDLRDTERSGYDEALEVYLNLVLKYEGPAYAMQETMQLGHDFFFFNPEPDDRENDLSVGCVVKALTEAMSFEGLHHALNAINDVVKWSLGRSNDVRRQHTNPQWRSWQVHYIVKFDDGSYGFQDGLKQTLLQIYPDKSVGDASQLVVRYFDTM